MRLPRRSIWGWSANLMSTEFQANQHNDISKGTATIYARLLTVTQFFFSVDIIHFLAFRYCVDGVFFLFDVSFVAVTFVKRNQK